MGPVTVYRCFNLAEADLVKARLEAAGFTAAIIHDTAALGAEGYSLSVGGVKVQVPEEQSAEARQLIEAPNEE